MVLHRARLRRHRCGLFGGQAPTEHDDFNGTIWKVGQNLAWDPHTEKGTGLHCVNLDDHNLYPFRDNRFAFYCHDIPTGAAIEYGASQRADPKPVENTIYLLADNLTDVAKIQTGGNGIQFWGVNGQSADIKFIEVTNAEGYALWDGGMNTGTNLRGISVEYGRAVEHEPEPALRGPEPVVGSARRGLPVSPAQPGTGPALTASPISGWARMRSVDQVPPPARARLANR